MRSLPGGGQTVRCVPLFLMALGSLGCSSKEPFIRELRSPQSSYSVRLHGDSSPVALWSLAEHQVYADVYRGSTPLVLERRIHFADNLDSAFADEYSDPVWRNEHVLCFPSRANVVGDEDTLVIRNESSRGHSST